MCTSSFCYRPSLDPHQRAAPASRTQCSPITLQYGKRGDVRYAAPMLQPGRWPPVWVPNGAVQVLRALVASEPDPRFCRRRPGSWSGQPLTAPGGRRQRACARMDKLTARGGCSGGVRNKLWQSQRLRRVCPQLPTSKQESARGSQSWRWRYQRRIIASCSKPSGGLSVSQQASTQADGLTKSDESRRVYGFEKRRIRPHL